MFYQHSDFLFPFLIIIGVGFAVKYILGSIKKLPFSKAATLRLIVTMSYAGIGLYLGARLFDNLFHYIKYQSDLAAGLNPAVPSYQGITYLGGFISAILVFTPLYLIFLKDYRYLTFKVLGIIATGFALAHFWGRIGCFCAGCCYGEITDSFIGVIFPPGSNAYNKIVAFYSLSGKTLSAAGEIASHTKVIPTQLIEAFYVLGLFFVLIRLKKYRFQVYLAAYGVFRFIIEFFRFDNRGSLFLNISPSQGLSLLLIIVAIGLFLLQRYYLDPKGLLEKETLITSETNISDIQQKTAES